MDDLTGRMWAIGGGKGGVGKSVVTLLVGAALARLGRKVVMIDADLGGSNLHTLTGIRDPQCTLADFVSRKVETIEQLALDTPVDNLKLICGADDILGLANPKSAQKGRLFTHLARLDADIILLDLGAGTSFTAIDFFLYAPNRIVVVTPQITSIQNAYGFIKSSLYRSLNQTFNRHPDALELIKRASRPGEGETIDSVARLHEALRPLGEGCEELLLASLEGLKIKLLVNMARNVKEKNVSGIVKSVAKSYLGLDIEEFGAVPYDGMIEASINRMSEFLAGRKDCVANMSFYDIASMIIRDAARRTDLRDNSARRSVEPSAGESATPLARALPRQTASSTAALR
jgi:flagellar biosynthesis protein FlhG